MPEQESLDSGLPLLPSDDDLRSSAKSYAEYLNLFTTDPDDPKQAEKKKAFIREHGVTQYQTPGSDKITRVYYQLDGSYVKISKTMNDWTRYDNPGSGENS